MTELERSGSKMRKLFTASMSRAKSGGAFGSEVDAAMVRLIDLPRRLPATPIEQRLASALKEACPISIASLVKRVAAELYSDELRQGAGILDIGLIGDRLFNRDVLRELRAADGVLWVIKEEREIV